VKLDAGIQAADALERGTAHGEVAAAEDRADPQQGLDQRLRQRRHGHVVGADQRAPAQVPVVEAIRRRDGNQRRPFQESALDLLEPLERARQSASTYTRTSPVASELSLLTTMISSGGLDCASSE